MNSRKPNFDPEALYQKALAQHNAGKLNEAENSYKKLLAHFPDHPVILTTYGTLLFQQGRHKEGLSKFRKSLNIAPKQPRALYNLGVELQKQGKLEEALECYDQAIALNPNELMVHINRGNTLRDLSRFDEALTSYDRAIAMNPNAAPAYWNKAMLSLLVGDYANGWRLYEWGIQCGKRRTPNTIDRPKWLGETSINGKTLFIQAEQGLGDIIQYCRYAPMAEALGAKVLLEAPATLHPLLSTLSGNITLIEKGQIPAEVDLVCPVMSLPLAFRTTLESIPAQTPYLSATEERRIKWQQRLGTKTKPRVGLVWSGSTTHENDRQRSIPLELFKPILELPLEFHSLQKEIRPEDKSTLNKLKQLNLHHEALDDFADTAALIEAMDVVLSVDTSVVHLAGAMNRPIWTLLAYTPDFRWMLNRQDSPWYPSAKLFRQEKAGDWASVIAAVKSQLQSNFSN